MYDLIIKNLDFNSRIKIIEISKYLGYYILTNKHLWNDIEIYNPRGYKYILDFIKNINDNPCRVLCVSSGVIKINLDSYKLDKLEHLNLSNSKISFNNLVKILYKCKLKKLYLKRINLYGLVRHIVNSQKDTLEELDLSISKRHTYQFQSKNLNNIHELNKLKILKINNNSIMIDIFLSIIKMKNLKELEIKDVLINKRYNYCICYDLKYILPYLYMFDKITTSEITFCKNTIDILKIKLKYKLII